MYIKANALITNVNIIDLYLDPSKVHNHIHKVQSNANALTALRGTGHGTWYKIVQRQKGPMPVPGGAGPVMMVTPDDARRRGDERRARQVPVPFGAEL